MSTPTSDLKRTLQIIGKWIITPFFAVGSGLITTVATSTFPFISALALPWLIPILITIFIAETMVSVYLFKDSVPETLTAIFVDNIFKNLTPIKKILLGLGIFSGMGGGLALAALTYMSGTTALTSIFAIVSLAVPPIGIAAVAVLAVVGFIAFTSLLTKWISSAIKNDVHKEVLNYFKEIFTRDKNKPLAQQILEGFFKLLFTTSILLLTLVGTIATLGTMQKGLIGFFSLIPKANLFAVQLASGMISYGLMGISRLPWALQSVCTVFSNIGEGIGRHIFSGVSSILHRMGVNVPVALHPKSNEKSETVLSTVAKITAILIHGFSFGAIAKSGGGAVLSNMMTKLNAPLTAATVERTGQIASVVSGGMMATGISGFAFFKRNKKQADSLNPESNPPKAIKPPSLQM